MIQAFIAADTIRSLSQDAFSLYESSRFGEKSGKHIEYAPVEALYLISEDKLEEFRSTSSKSLSFDTLIALLRKQDKKLSTKIAVYAALRSRGYIIKTARKFGAEFRVYEKGIKPGEQHARWILFTSREHETLNWHDFAAKNRVAHAAKKNLLLPCFPASKDLCTLGGMVANNAGGEKTLAYGKTEDYVEQLKVVLADGNEYAFKPISREELAAKLSLSSFEGYFRDYSNYRI